MRLHNWNHSATWPTRATDDTEPITPVARLEQLSSRRSLRHLSFVIQTTYPKMIWLNLESTFTVTRTSFLFCFVNLCWSLWLFIEHLCFHLRYLIHSTTQHLVASFITSYSFLARLLHSDSAKLTWTLCFIIFSKNLLECFSFRLFHFRPKKILASKVSFPFFFPHQFVNEIIRAT